MNSKKNEKFNLHLNNNFNFSNLHRKANSLSIRSPQSTILIKKSKEMIDELNKYNNFEDNDKTKTFIIESLLTFAKSSLTDVESSLSYSNIY